MSAQRQRSASSRPSQRVFWARRLLVGGTLFAVLFGVGRFLLAEGGPDTGQQATAAAAKTKGGSDQQSSQAQVFGPQPVPFDSLGAPTASAIAEPEIPSSGPCSDSAITATPEVVDAVAGRPVVINLKLTGTLPACSFKAGPKTLAVKITSGKDPIWSSMDCPRSIPSREVVVRAGTPQSCRCTGLDDAQMKTAPSSRVGLCLASITWRPRLWGQCPATCSLR